MVRSVLSLCVAVVLTGFLAGSDDVLERWRRLPEEKRRVLVSAYRRLRSLPEKKRQELLESWRKFRQLPESERRVYLRKWQAFRRLPKQKRQRLIERHRKWKRFIRHLTNLLPEQRRKELLLMPPHRRLKEFRRLFRGHSLKLFRKITEHLPEDEVRALLALPDDEFLMKMRELIRNRKRILYESMLKTVPRHMQLKLAQMPEYKRQDALKAMVAASLKEKIRLLEEAGLDASVLETLPFDARLLAVNGAYRKLIRKVATAVKNTFKSITDERTRREIERALLSGKKELVPEPIRRKEEIELLFRLPTQIRKDALNLLRRKPRLHPPLLPPRGTPIEK